MGQLDYGDVHAMTIRAFNASETVQCGDEEYTLSIDIGVIDALEDEFDISFDQILPQTIGKGRVGKASRLLRGLLLPCHPEITLNETGALAIQYGEEIGEAITNLIIKASPEAPEEKDTNPLKAHRGIGASSSSRGAQQASRRRNSGAKRHALSS